MYGVKANSGVWMENTRLRNPPISELTHPLPSEVMLLAPMDQHGPPEPNHSKAKCRQTVGVTRYRVERTPDKVAVVCEGRQWTYRDLNEQANQLAQNLQTLGVGPDVLVALSVERSLEMLVGIWASSRPAAPICRWTPLFRPSV